MTTPLQLSSTFAGFYRAEAIEETFLSATGPTTLDLVAPLTSTGIAPQLIGGGYAIFTPSTNQAFDCAPQVVWNGPNDAVGGRSNNEWRVRLILPADPSGTLIGMLVYGYFATFTGAP